MNFIRVLHVIRSIDPMTGGPTFAIAQMAKILGARGVTVDVATTVPPEDYKADISGIVPIIQDGARYFYFLRQVGETWSFSLQLWSWLRRNILNYDLVHITGVFTFPAIIAAREAKKGGIPYIIRPAGTLDVYPLAQKAWRKKLYYRLFLSGILAGADAIHTTSQSERSQLGRLGWMDKCVVIPLAVDLPVLERTERRVDLPLHILFLSRIHPKKGLPVFFKAISILQKRGVSVSLTIAGEGKQSYLNELNRLIGDLDLNGLVDFAGFVQGEEKLRLLAETDLFVLPSYQENFGIAVAEAMAAGLPVVVSDQVALAEEIMAFGAGVVVPVGKPDILADAIAAFTDLDYREKTGRKARELVERQFTSDRQGQQLEALYRSIIMKRGRTDGIK